jgi:3-dehydrosphinganine reductase
MDIDGRCAIVTGGSSGIGKAVAKELARRGANVFLVARREEPLKAAVGELQEEAGDASQRFGFFSADVADLAAVEGAVKAAEAECGPAAVLVNSAGIVNPGYAEELPISGMEAEIKVNYLGSVYMIKQVLNGMIERRRGWILNVSSLGGLKGIFGYTGYSGSKFAIVGFSEALRSELRPYGVRVSVLCPPDVDTPTFEEENKVKPLETMRISEGGKVMQPDDVARAAIEGLERGSFIIIPNLPGKILRIANRLVPSLVDKFIDSTVDRARKERGFIE